MTVWSPDAFRARYADLALEVDDEVRGELRVVVDGAGALTLLRRLHDDLESPFVRLVDLTVIDREAAPHRFEVVYRLDSKGRTTPLRVHARIEAASTDASGEGESSSEPAIDSVVPLWPVAAWLEREAYGLFGIRFRGHPELRRLLLAEDFDGAPMRKDFPRAGRVPSSFAPRPLPELSGEGPE